MSFGRQPNEPEQKDPQKIPIPEKEPPTRNPAEKDPSTNDQPFIAPPDSDSIKKKEIRLSTVF